MHWCFDWKTFGSGVFDGEFLGGPLGCCCRRCVVMETMVLEVMGGADCVSLTDSKT